MIREVTVVSLYSVRIPWQCVIYCSILTLGPHPRAAVAQVLSVNVSYEIGYMDVSQSKVFSSLRCGFELT